MIETAYVKELFGRRQAIPPKHRRYEENCESITGSPKPKGHLAVIRDSGCRETVTDYDSHRMLRVAALGAILRIQPTADRVKQHASSLAPPRLPKSSNSGSPCGLTSASAGSLQIAPIVPQSMA